MPIVAFALSSEGEEYFFVSSYLIMAASELPRVGCFLIKQSFLVLSFSIDLLIVHRTAVNNLYLSMVVTFYSSLSLREYCHVFKLFSCVDCRANPKRLWSSSV